MTVTPAGVQWDGPGRQSIDVSATLRLDTDDPIDQVTSSELKAASFQESTLAANTLKQVKDALRRIDDGSYGKCIDCDRPIEPARLEAVPWTPYCLADQKKHDRPCFPVISRAT